jgi:hypothetical protein
MESYCERYVETQSDRNDAPRLHSGSVPPRVGRFGA